MKVNRKWVNWCLTLGLLFGIFQLVLGWSMVQMLQRSEDQVSRIVEDQVSGLNRIQFLTRASGNVHRSVLNLMLSDSEKDRSWAHERLNLSIREVEKLIETMPESGQEGDRKGAGSRAREAWNQYKEAVRQIEQVSERKDKTQATQLRTELLRPRFESLQIANSEWADATESEARSKADQIKTEFSKTRKMLMGLAAAPLLLGIFLCVGVAVIFIWLFFRLPNE